MRLSLILVAFFLNCSIAKQYSKDDINAMSMSELKSLLKEQGIRCSGCLEKAEWRQAAYALVSEPAHDEKNYQAEEEDDASANTFSESDAARIISEFLEMDSADADLVQRLVNKYKDGRAFDDSETFDHPTHPIVEEMNDSSESDKPKRDTKQEEEKKEEDLSKFLAKLLSLGGKIPTDENSIRGGIRMMRQVLSQSVEGITSRAGPTGDFLLRKMKSMFAASKDRDSTQMMNLIKSSVKAALNIGNKASESFSFMQAEVAKILKHPTLGKLFTSKKQQDESEEL